MKRMNPNGFVAAASMTSQTSRPIRSHSRASWLTNAMFTLRKTFSRSLAISAASGDDTSTTRSLMWRSRARARSVAAGGHPADEAGDLARRARRVARVDALGRIGEVEVRAGDAGRPPRGSPGTVRSSCPGRSSTGGRSAGRAGCGRGGTPAAARTGPRSGSLVALIGVGTHTKTASASATRASASVDDPQTPASAGPRAARRRCRRSASDPRRMVATRSSETVDPLDVEARLGEGDRPAAGRRSRARRRRRGVGGHPGRGPDDGVERRAVASRQASPNDSREPTDGRPATIGAHGRPSRATT